MSIVGEHSRAREQKKRRENCVSENNKIKIGGE